MLLFRLSGSFLLRFDERRLSVLLFQEPPRTTREDGAVQAPSVQTRHHEIGDGGDTRPPQPRCQSPHHGVHGCSRVIHRKNCGPPPAEEFRSRTGSTDAHKT